MEGDLREILNRTKVGERIEGSIEIRDNKIEGLFIYSSLKKMLFIFQDEYEGSCPSWNEEKPSSFGFKYSWAVNMDHDEYRFQASTKNPKIGNLSKEFEKEFEKYHLKYFKDHSSLTKIPEGQLYLKVERDTLRIYLRNNYKTGINTCLGNFTYSWIIGDNKFVESLELFDKPSFKNEERKDILSKTDKEIYEKYHLKYFKNFSGSVNIEVGQIFVKLVGGSIEGIYLRNNQVKGVNRYIGSFKGSYCVSKVDYGFKDLRLFNSREEVGESDKMGQYLEVVSEARGMSLSEWVHEVEIPLRSEFKIIDPLNSMGAIRSLAPKKIEEDGRDFSNPTLKTKKKKKRLI